MIKKSDEKNFNNQRVDEDTANYRPDTRNEASETIERMYEKGKIKMDNRDAAGLDRVIAKISLIDPKHYTVDILSAALCLFNGDPLHTYRHICSYLSRNPHDNIDLYALEIIAMFNLYIERYETALTQFSYITYRSTCRASKIISLFRIAVCKKRLGEYKLAQTILKMIIGTPEGYKNYLVIKLEIIHVKLLEGNIIEASSDLEKFINFKEHSGVIRLYIYILYKLNRYDDLFKYANMVHKDIYVDYIVLRTKFELNSVDENFEIAFEDLIKESKRNFAVITTYANYKVFNGKYNEALQYYDLAIDNNYTYYSAIKNKETLTKLLEQKDKFSEREFWNKIVDNIVDGDPEVESIGYFKLFLQDSCVDFLFNKKVFDTIPIVEVSLKEFD